MSMNFGERLREERKRLRMSQTEFGNHGGVEIRAQINYEKGERAPDVNYLSAIAKIGADVNYIITGERGPQAAVFAQQREQLIIEQFRIASDAQKHSVEVVLAAFAGRAGEGALRQQTAGASKMEGAANGEGEQHLLAIYRRATAMQRQVICLAAECLEETFDQSPCPLDDDEKCLIDAYRNGSAAKRKKILITAGCLDKGGDDRAANEGGI